MEDPFQSGCMAGSGLPSLKYKRSCPILDATQVQSLSTVPPRHSLRLIVPLYIL